MNEVIKAYEVFETACEGLKGLPYHLSVSVVCMILEVICKERGRNVKEVIREIAPIVDGVNDALGEI